MFVGELCCLFAWLIKRQIVKYRNAGKTEDEIPLSPGTDMAQKTKLKTKINPLYLAIPATCDICGSTLMFVALTQCAASVYQMMRGIIVVITALMSIIFLKRKQYFHHWTCIAFIVAGVAIVGFASIKASDDGDSGTTQTTFTGVILLLISQCFTGTQFISEEKILSGYYLDPLLVVGLEGFWGCLYYAILLPIFSNINCDGPLCHNGKLEDFKAAWHSMGEHPELIAQSVGIIFSISFFNASGVAVTKYASAAQRATVDTCRTLFIWLISMLVGWEKFLFLEMLGFIILVSATLVYNEIVILPIEICKRNTREER